MMKAVTFALFLLAAPAFAQSIPFPGPGMPASAGGGGGITIVQSAIIGSLSGPMTVTAGNLVSVGVAWCNDSTCSATGPFTVSGVTAGGVACAQATGSHIQGTTPTHQFATDVWLCKNVAGGATTFTATLTGSTTISALLLNEWHGASTTAPDDAKGNTNQSASASSLSVATNGSTTNSGEIIYSMCWGQNTTTAGQTLLNNDGGLIDEYQAAGAAGTYTNSVTLSAGAIIANVVAIK